VAEICDYQGSRYRTDFWEGQGREYEDRVERIALRRLLPPQGRRLMEIGAGYGRLADQYRGYDEVILLDYAPSQLQQARERLGDDGFCYVAADLYRMPLVDSCLDTAVMVRVMHHVQDPPRALSEISRVLTPLGAFILEYANKRNFKAILRYLLRRQEWDPFSIQPVEFVRLNFDFHPAYIQRQLRGAGFDVEDELAVSTFRLSLLKRLVPARLLASLDALIQRPTARLKLSPSLFLRARISKPAPGLAPRSLFRCPSCGSTPLSLSLMAHICGGCGKQWAIQDGIHNFREPMTA
jgi:SAM-dependent methyltransferase